MKKNTWIILGLVVVLGAIYFFTKQDKVSVGIKHLQLPSFDQAQVDRIEIGGKNKATLIKENNLWRLEMGEGDKKRLVSADQGHVASMLSAVLELKPSYYVTELSEKLKDLGLDDEKAIPVSLKAGDKLLWALVFGDNAANSGRYAKLPESKDVYVVKTAFWQLIRNNVIDWRDRTIWPANETDLRTFKLERTGENTLSLVKKEEATDWGFAEDQTGLPVSFRVNKSSLASLVRAATTMRASGFLDEEKALTAPVATIIATDKDKKEYSLKIYQGEADKLLVQISGNSQVFEIAKSSFDRLNRRLDDMRDLSLMNFDKATIQKISLADKGGRVILEKKEDKWHIVEPKTLPKDFEFDEKTADDIISITSGLSALRVADVKKDVPLSPSWASSSLVDLSDKEGKLYRVFAGKSKSKDEYLIKGTVDELTYVIPEGKLSALTTGIATFKKVNFDLPAIDERTPGFDSVPVDIQRKLLDATKKKMEQ